MRSIKLSICLAILASLSTGPVAFGQAASEKQESSTRDEGQAAAASPPSSSGDAQFGQMGQRPWFMNKAVQKRLNLSAPQFERMINIYGQAYYEYQTSLAEIDKDLMPQVRREQAALLYENFLKNFDTSLNSVLTDPDARQRYEELKMQYDGYRAFGDPALQSRMKLSPDQIRQFNQYQNDLDSRYSTLQKQYASDPVGFGPQYERLMLQRQDQINRTLTPEQRQQYESLAGQPYKFTPDFYFSTTSQLAASSVSGTTGSGANIGGGSSTTGSTGANGTSGGGGAAGGAGGGGGGGGGGD